MITRISAANLDTTAIVTLAGPTVATGGTVTFSNGYTIHTFTASGTFTA
jgi:type II secretory pathway component HofQ